MEMAKDGLNSKLKSIRGTPDKFLVIVQGNAVSPAISPLDVLTLVQSSVLRYLFVNLANRLCNVWKERLLAR